MWARYTETCCERRSAGLVSVTHSCIRDAAHQHDLKEQQQENLAYTKTNNIVVFADDTVIRPKHNIFESQANHAIRQWQIHMFKYAGIYQSIFFFPNAVRPCAIKLNKCWNKIILAFIAAFIVDMRTYKIKYNKCCNEINRIVIFILLYFRYSHICKKIK